MVVCLPCGAMGLSAVCDHTHLLLFGHQCHTCIWGVFTKSPAGCSSLNHFKPGNKLLM